MATPIIEEWRPIGKAAGYEVSNLGRVRSLDRVVNRGRFSPQWFGGRVLKPGGVGGTVGRRYPAVALPPRGKTNYVHDLVMAAFVGPKPPGYEVNHINGIISDNRIQNLEYVTRTQNRIHARDTFGEYLGERNPMARLTRREVIQIRMLFETGRDFEELAQQFGVKRGTIKAIVRRRRWKHVA